MAEDESDRTFAPVSESESGQKLLRFLERRLALPQALLHRWIRTGQIRIGGKRCKPFARVNAGDIVRLPPFALNLGGPREFCEEAALWPEMRIREKLADAGLELAGYTKEIWALEKPVGLPAQSGSEHTDSVAERLKQGFRNCVYVPAPAHRLDRDTGGLLLVGATFEAQRKLHEDYAGGNIIKEYLAWSEGRWPHEKTLRVRHYLEKTMQGNVEKAVAHRRPVDGGREAICLVRPLLVQKSQSLLQIRLFTGRYHQIRAQLAALGHPVTGDGKYGKYDSAGLKLHAFRVILPDGVEFVSRPSWLEGMSLPESLGGQAEDYAEV